jgi:uncharacterized membrane protein
MTDAAGEPSSDKPVGTLLNELAGLILAYVKQETIDPLKSLLRFVAFGVAGALLIGIGGALATLAAVRAIQAETGAHLTGNLDWVPYTGGILLAFIIAGWSASRIAKGGAK